MQTMLSEAGEVRLRTLIEHFDVLTSEPVTQEDQAEITAVALEIIEIVRDHKAVLDLSLSDKQDLVRLLERRLELTH